jgi:carbon monoxide dehydrogenase subunit G
MAKVSASKIINKPIKEVFEYTASPFNGPAFIPNLSENTNITPKEPGKGQTFNWRFTLVGVDLKGKAEVVQYDYPHKVIVKSTGDSNTTWVYTFAEEGKATKVRVDIDYEVVENVLQKVVNRFVVDKLNQRTAEQMLDNLKTILEG